MLCSRRELLHADGRPAVAVFRPPVERASKTILPKSFARARWVSLSLQDLRSARPRRHCCSGTVAGTPWAAAGPKQCSANVQRRCLGTIFSEPERRRETPYWNSTAAHRIRQHLRPSVHGKTRIFEFSFQLSPLQRMVGSIVLRTGHKRHAVVDDISLGLGPVLLRMLRKWQ